MPEMSWRDAVTKILEEAGEPLHFTEIADQILDQRLKERYGATPQATVNATISKAIKEEGSGCVFVRTGRGEYALRGRGDSGPDGDGDAESGSLEAFGVYWKRSLVQWSSGSRLFGRTHPRADRVNLAGQQGVYLLYDENGAVVYVGKAVRQSIAQRLAQHTRDRLTGRWERFSWFGIRPVDNDGELGDVVVGTITPDRLISALEALLIEALEPRQNRAGSSHSGIEYVQAADPQM